MAEELCIKQPTHEYMCYIYLNSSCVVAAYGPYPQLTHSLPRIVLLIDKLYHIHFGRQDEIHIDYCVVTVVGDNDDIFDNTLYDDVCHLPKNYIPENERPILTPQQKLDRVEKIMKNMGMEIPTDVGDGYPHKMSTKAKERILETKQKERRMSSSDKKNLKMLKLGRLWVCRKLALEPLEEKSIRVVSEPTPELKSILKPGSTFKPHGSKHDHSKKHHQKSSHDAGSREAKVHFVPTTKIARYSSESSVLQEYDIQLPSLRSKFNRFKRQMLRFIGYKKST
ncbi:hypothetical protein BATDEDRAFT_23766 [Batrachochytrium dendrobatidis JAM81]|uniref:Uncharacterized protein n=1 Tax=Batrachochytrium dendrobatidis (strain JAM81 / FGSC 10211) TaxID=684364 RepID=F4P051_BATDJ|nr:uncharacterized protein BATDEDRAFT_23766 [Batrachochytrium dendrobatidis JAM81]XP_006683127.1 uncharacterized protein BATDEDRAFT_28691 [Batrachochytrium dendrobatidis JAM81]EGF76237.1 hypothetical protein BATDEDRAFT_28691 [Batrachochytrium dendrobatidis JAM81]EGF81378.1 hypothetical protein BATDEDRAFT_23766 [Batrachochytrium dendrobatidis JAM81]|eukprot:XP_006677825.1 hypothetical protein BATDEDRAFT_23766 [Batrachochytrium dendrobatidis JAM81]